MSPLSRHYDPKCTPQRGFFIPAKGQGGSSHMSAPKLYNTTIEQHLLACALLENDTLTLADPCDFHDPAIAEAWEVAQGLSASGGVDAATLDDALQKHGSKERLNLDDLLKFTSELFQQGSTVNAPVYAERAKAWRKQRETYHIVTELSKTFGNNGTFDAALPAAAEKITALIQSSAGDVEYRTADQIADYYGNVTWMWDSWIPRGHMTMIVGPQGVGKSFLAGRLIGTMTGCLPTWPDDSQLSGDPCKVMIIETEEMRGAYVQRMDAMDISRNWYFFGPGDETYIPNLVEDAHKIEALAETEQAGAIFVDSLSGGHSLEENANDMKHVLQSLASMASRLNVPVIVLHHPRKKSQHENIGMTLDRVRGSTTITQFCRSVMAIHKPDESLDVVKLESIKSTFCAPPDAIGFSIDDSGIAFCDAPTEPRKATQVDLAVDFLLIQLKREPQPNKQLEKDASAAGISTITLRRAKKKLGVVSIKKEDGRWYWSLPVKEDVSI